MNILFRLLNNSYIKLFISLIGFTGTIWSIAFAIKSKKRKEITATRCRYYISDDLRKKYKKIFNIEDISDLSITRIYIWNSGNMEIEESDFASSAKLAIEGFKDCKLLSVAIEEKSEICNFILDDSQLMENNKAPIHFEYFKPNDCVRITVLHKGSFKNMKAVGIIKDGEEIKNNKIDLDSSSIIFHTNFAFVLFLTGLTLMLENFICFLHLNSDWIAFSERTSLFIKILSWIVFFIALGLCMHNHKRWVSFIIFNVAVWQNIIINCASSSAWITFSERTPLFVKILLWIVSFIALFLSEINPNWISSIIFIVVAWLCIISCADFSGVLSVSQSNLIIMIFAACTFFWYITVKKRYTTADWYYFH